MSFPANTYFKTGGRKWRFLAAAVPYAAVALGFGVAHNAWTALLFYHAGIIGFLVFAEPAGVLKAVRSGWKIPAAVCGGAAATLGGVMLLLLWPVAGTTDAGLAAKLSEFGLGRVSWVLFFVYYSTAHPLLEELHWRGVLYTDRKRPSWLDVAFGGYHVFVLSFFMKLPWALAAGALLVVVAWVWRTAVREYGGLGIPLVTHAAADLSIVLAASLLDTGLVWGS